MRAASIYIEDIEIEEACRAFLDDASYHEVRNEIMFAIDEIFARRAAELGRPYERIGSIGFSGVPATDRRLAVCGD
jgi:hypothetical protein